VCVWEVVFVEDVICVCRRRCVCGGGGVCVEEEDVCV
jgi:hypothetical protein